jgi:MobA-like NTP transferase domain
LNWPINRTHEQPVDVERGRLVNALIKAFASTDYAVVPEHDGAWGNPVLLSRSAWSDTENLDGDGGGRQLLRARANQVRLLPRDRSCLLDIGYGAKPFGVKLRVPNSLSFLASTVCRNSSLSTKINGERAKTLLSRAAGEALPEKSCRCRLAAIL